MRDLAAGTAFRATMSRVLALLTKDDANLSDHLRCVGALRTLHAAVIGLEGVAATVVW
ncbi:MULTISPECIES: hypothetical protein [unclassified Streptomyces]|uniref:hypothetical protein n=1 Tax=unclassified Streptomyces TaxID=2593676 RepID=UPI00336A9E34